MNVMRNVMEPPSRDQPLSPIARPFVYGETTTPKEGTMQYALLINIKPGSFEELTPEQQEAISAEYFAVAQDPHCIGGEQLQGVETATTVRVQDGQTLVTDGPFADTKEYFGGYYVFEADDLDTVLAVAAKIPAARMGGGIEIRPVVERQS
jgi:hypothetical protein